MVLMDVLCGYEKTPMEMAGAGSGWEEAAKMIGFFEFGGRRRMEARSVGYEQGNKQNVERDSSTGLDCVP